MRRTSKVNLLVFIEDTEIDHHVETATETDHLDEAMMANLIQIREIASREESDRQSETMPQEQILIQDMTENHA